MGIQMKKFLVLIAACMLAVPAVSSAKGLKGMTQSQFNKKGKFAISGDVLSFNNIKLDDGDAEPSAFGLAPTIGYMAIDNLQINVGIGYMSTTDGAEGDAESTMSQWVITPGVSYYFDQLSKKNLFPSVGLSYAIGSRTTEQGGNEAETSLGTLTVGAGITQALGAAQGGFLTFGIDYVMQTLTPDADGADDIKSSGLDVNVSFGLYF